MRERFDSLKAAALEAVVVVSQKRENVAAWVAKHPLPFPVLVDDDRSRAKRWGVYVAFSYDSIHIARPASFVVDRFGILRYGRVGRHQRDPAPFPEILAAAGRR